jgi:phosphatidylglycerol---prolipoprotein diacylglyceryl transferase
MTVLVIPYPVIDPVAFHVGPFPIRWYALSYIGGLALGWLYAGALIRNNRLWGDRPRPRSESIADLVLYLAIGVVVGGRLGQVIFYQPDYFFAHPLEIFELWLGGMSFHGGMIGAALAIWYFARETKVSPLTVGDICAAAAPIGIFLVRIANFIKPELWGRPTDVAWAMIFPGVDDQPRHPNQLYEAGLEGLLLFLVLALFVRAGALKRPGIATGIFLWPSAHHFRIFSRARSATGATCARPDHGHGALGAACPRQRGAACLCAAFPPRRSWRKIL